MDTNKEVIKVINDNLRKNSDFEFIADLKELTISDFCYIERLSNIKKIKSRFNYQVIDNIYIKIHYSY